MARTQTYNPFDPYAEEEPGLRRPRAGSPYIPAPLTGTTTTDTGIPFVPPEEGGFTGNQPAYNPPGLTPGLAATKPASAQKLLPDPQAPPAVAPPSVTPAPQAMAGWDQTKWADPAHTTIKYQAGRIMSQFDPVAIRQNPLPLLSALRAAGINATMVGDDKVDFGDGYGPIDIITREGTWAWMPDRDQGQTGGATAGSFMPALYQQAQQAMSGGGSMKQTPGGHAGFDEAIRQMVLRLMGQQPVDMNDPVYAGAMSAYGQQQQRAKERQRNAIAERSAAEGTLNTGGFSDRILGAEQAQGEAEAAFAGNLAVRELERQRDEIIQALTIGAGLMTEADRLALQEKLGLINAALQQQSITNQNTQFNQGLGWQQDMFEYGANQDWWQ